MDEPAGASTTAERATSAEEAPAHMEASAGGDIFEVSGTKTEEVAKGRDKAKGEVGLGGSRDNAGKYQGGGGGECRRHPMLWQGA